MLGGNIHTIVYPKLRKEHTNQWVVFSRDTREVLASGKTLQEALKASSQKQNTGVMLVPESLPYSPIVQ